MELETPIELTERILNFAPEVYPGTSAAHNATSQSPTLGGDGTSESPPRGRRGPRGSIHFPSTHPQRP